MTHGGNTFGKTFITLAPYYLPIFTFAFLLLRIIGAWESLCIFDLFIGFTLAFHCLCFIKQTRSYQTDIQNIGYLKAYLFIACALLFNLTIVLLSIRKGIVNANIYLFSNYWNGIFIKALYYNQEGHFDGISEDRSTDVFEDSYWHYHNTGVFQWYL